MSDYFHRLPDELLTNILKRLPLEDKISQEVVCVRWQSVLLNHVFPSIKSLTLYQHSFAWNYQYFSQLMFFEPLHYTPYYDHNSVPVAVSTLDRSVCETLVRKMPNITKLAIYGIIIEVVDFDEVIFPKWKQLETIIFGVSFYDIEEYVYDWNEWQLAVGNNNLTSLKHLALFAPEFPEHSDWPVLKQLETFSLDIYRQNYPYDYNVLDKLGPNLRALSFSNVLYPMTTYLQKFHTMITAKPELATSLSDNLTHLTLQGHLIEEEDVQHFFTDQLQLAFVSLYFKSLTHLDINLYDLITPHADVFRLLSPLTQLTNLRLTYDSTNQKYDDRNHFFDQLIGNVSSLDSMKILHLNIPTAPDKSFYFNLPKAIPNLEMLRFEGIGKMYSCDCARTDRQSRQTVDQLFYGEFRCELCPENIWHSLVERNEHLQFVYRNNRVVFDRTRDSEHSDGFKLRLEQFGLAEFSN